MPITKKYQSKDTICKVTFSLPEGVNANEVYLTGEFNDWDQTSTPMKQLKSGEWKVDVKLDAGSEYQYRYLLDGEKWQNDPEADGYEAHPYGGENSVVIT